MARRWWTIGQLRPGRAVREPGSTPRFESGWQLKLAINGFGAVCTAVVAPRFVPSCWWRSPLHTQAAAWLRLALLFRPGVVVTGVPYHVD